MIRRPPRSTRTDTLFPYTTLFRSLMPRLSGVDLAMTGMPGMANHAPMKIGGATTAVGEDGKTLIVTLARPLTAGSYKVDWHAVAADRSEERRGGKAWVSTYRSRWSPYH